MRYCLTCGNIEDDGCANYWKKDYCVWCENYDFVDDGLTHDDFLKLSDEKKLEYIHNIIKIITDNPRFIRDYTWHNNLMEDHFISKVEYENIYTTKGFFHKRKEVFGKRKIVHLTDEIDYNGWRWYESIWSEKAKELYEAKYENFTYNLIERYYPTQAELQGIKEPIAPQNDANTHNQEVAERMAREMELLFPTAKCPTCGSTSVEKITTTSRVVSTATLGIASSNLGKTMKCNKCGYKW